jgi:hypothetical protein
MSNKLEERTNQTRYDGNVYNPSKWRQEDCKFETSLINVARLQLKIKAEV